MKLINFKDRFARFLIAGTAASLILLALNLLSYMLQFSNRRFINYAAIMIFGRKSSNFTEDIIGCIAQIIFATGLIIVFSHLIFMEKRENYFLRGISIGLGSWLGVMSLCYIIGIHKILTITIGSATSFLVTSLIWGIIYAWFLSMLDKKYDYPKR